jgi:hypothetical protein
MFTFTLAQWQAWAPGVSLAEDWLSWAHAPYCPLAGHDEPRLNFLPPMQRRRLSGMARAAVACAWTLAEGQPALPMVFASQHGETSRNFELLQALAREEPLSPTSFGLSVHNATAGTWSILRRETQESVALSAQDDSWEHALLEAALLLGDGAPGVILLASEEVAPAAYARWIGHGSFPFALALHLKRGDQFTLECASGGEAPEAALPHALSFLRNMLLDTPQWRHGGEQRSWAWRRKS